MNDRLVELLGRYLRFLKPAGRGEFACPCPFHKGGQERKPSCYINIEKGVFHCHTCKESGTLPKMLKRLRAPREAIDSASSMIQPETKKQRERRRFTNPEDEIHLLNEGLLGVFDFKPTDLTRAGFDPKTLRSMDIGFDRKNMRITFPIRDKIGRLVGISGRDVTGNGPKYHVYKSKVDPKNKHAPNLLDFAPDDPEAQARYRNYDIKSHFHLWNFHNVYPALIAPDSEVDALIIVEGYKACLWLLQHGIDNVVAVQGSRLSWQQRRMLQQFRLNIILFLDANEAGMIGTLKTGPALLRDGHRVAVAEYPDWCDESAQPDNLDRDEVYDALDNVISFRQWRRECRITLPKEKPPSAAGSASM